MKVWIVDDEAMARQRLKRLLSAVPGVEVVGESASGEHALSALQTHSVDALFLDIHMPGLLGTEVAGVLGAEGPLLVFTTAHAQHAVDAFGLGAVDYIMKPVSAERIRKAVDRLSSLVSPAERPAPGKLAVPTAKGVQMVNLDTLTHATIEGQSLVLHAESRIYTDWHLAELMRRLPATGFLRVHRQATINLAHLQRLDAVDSGGYIALLTGGHKVAVSRQAARNLRRAWRI